MAKLKISFPSYQQPESVTFGTGSIKTLASCEGLEDTVFFMSGQEDVRRAVTSSLSKRGYDLDRARVICKPPGEPTGEMVQLGVEFLHRKPYARVVGIGGGSVMDWCRLAWAESQGLLVCNEGKGELKGHGGRRPEFWLVPTTCGTGGEAANLAVFSRDGKKTPVISSAFLADRVILDGQFLRYVTPAALAKSLCDALSHAIEAFVSIVPCRLAKEAAVASLQLILEGYAKEHSPSRNDRLMEAGYLGGVAAANCSVGVIHAFAHTVAPYGISHGHGNALGLIAGIYTNAEVPAMRQLYRRCGAESLEAFVAWLWPIVHTALSSETDLELLALLRDQSVRESISEQMAADVCMRSNPQPLGSKELHAFLDSVMETVESYENNVYRVSRVGS